MPMEVSKLDLAFFSNWSVKLCPEGIGLANSLKILVSDWLANQNAMFEKTDINL